MILFAGSCASCEDSQKADCEVMSVPSDSQQSAIEGSGSTKGPEYPKQTDELLSGSIALLGKLSASALVIVGFVYVMGYVIVNGYQTKAMNYGANALQLKHLAAGLLYVFLTLFVVLGFAFTILLKWLDVKFSSQRATEQELEKMSRLRRVLDRARSIGRYFWTFGGGLFVTFLLILLFFQFIGMSIPSTNYGALFVIGAMLPWMGINLILSIVVAIGVYKGGSKSFETAFASQTQPPAACSEQESSDKKTVAAFEKRQFLEALAGWVVAPVLGLVLLLFSLVSFQGLYGRLRPDYGGGALYRVAIHLKSPSSVPSPSPTPSLSSAASPSSAPSLGSLFVDWKERIKSKDSWLLLVDKDGSFVYVLRVDIKGNKQLLEISSGEIEAVEVLSDPPISPADARFFIQ